MDVLLSGHHLLLQVLMFLDEVRLSGLPFAPAESKKLGVPVLGGLSGGIQHPFPLPNFRESARIRYILHVVYYHYLVLYLVLHARI